MVYRIEKIHRSCRPGIGNIAGKDIDAVLEMPAGYCDTHEIKEGQVIDVERKIAQKVRIDAARADFIPDFIGRQCGNCAYYIWGEKTCNVAPALGDVYPNQYCDGYYPTELYIEKRGPVTLSRFYNEIIENAPYMMVTHVAKNAINFYDNIKGVNCGSCWWQDFRDESVCNYVDTMISSYCCCSFWNVGKEDAFVGLGELRSGLIHGGSAEVVDPETFQHGGADIREAQGEASTTENTEPDSRFVAGEGLNLNDKMA